MIKRLLFTLSLLFLLQGIIDAQITDRYWDYRVRLDNQFLVVGDGQGYSVPAAYRNPLSGIIKWSDATVDHGWYLGVLATEHFLLNAPGQFPNYGRKFIHRNPFPACYVNDFACGPLEL